MGLSVTVEVRVIFSLVTVPSLGSKRTVPHFCPVREMCIRDSYGTIIENWPTIEPMLMGLVETLSSGLSEAMPVLLDLGQTLIPTLTDVVGTLFEAATPILSVVGELASQILPPLVGSRCV